MQRHGRNIYHIYDKASSAIQMSGSPGERFRTAVVVKQESIPLPTLISDFQKQGMSIALTNMMQRLA